MTSPARELQAAIHSTLTGNVPFMAMVQGVYDRIPKGASFPYCSFGGVSVVAADATCVTGGEYTLQLDVWSRVVGSGECYDIMDAAKRLIHEGNITLADNAMNSIRVTGSREFDDPDGLTRHGVLTIRAMIEER